MKNKIRIYVDEEWERDPRKQNLMLSVGDRNPIKITTMKMFKEYPESYLSTLSNVLSEEVKKNFTETFVNLFYTEESLDEQDQ